MMRAVLSRRLAPRCCLVAAVLGAGAARAQDVPNARPGAVRGVTYDSLASAPLAGATVQIAPAGDLTRARTAIADSLGRFRFDSVAAGRYVIGFVHPAVLALGLDMPLRALVVDSTPETVVELALPGGPTLRRVLCGEQRDSTGAIVGTARDAESALPLDDATVMVTWRELRITRGEISSVMRHEPVRASAGGVFVVCGAPSEVELALRAEAKGRSSGEVLLRVPPRGLVRQDLALGDSARRDAKVAGTVVDEHGRAIERASISVVGAGARVPVTAEGDFRLDGLAAGTWTLEARAIGYEVTRLPVAIARAAESRVRVILRPHPPTLDRVVVFGKPTSAAHLRGMEGFFNRRAKGYGGAFLTQEDLEGRRAFHVSALLDGVKGLMVLPGANASGGGLRGRGGCRPEVFVDGVLVVNGADEIDNIVGPYDLMAAEVYPSVADTPPEFIPPQGGRCGAVILWTKK